MNDKLTLVSEKRLRQLLRIEKAADELAKQVDLHERGLADPFDFAQSLINYRNAGSEK